MEQRNKNMNGFNITIRKILILGLSCILISTLTACKKATTEEDNKVEFTQISQEEAKKIIDSNEDVTILDVRAQEEYDQGHIEEAIVLPHTQIEEKAEELLPDKNQTILVYCRSGVRSVIAAQKLVDMGYTDIREFGGIVTWEYDIVTD